MDDPTLSPYSPTWRDSLARVLMGEGKASPDLRRIVEGLLGSSGLGNTGMSLSDLTPAGGVLGLQEAAQHGDRTGMAVNAMSMIPGAAMTKGIGGAARGVDDLTTALRSKYPGVDFWISGKEGKPLTVSKVVVPPESRGQGVGTSFMNDVMQFADQSGVPVALSPSADFGGNKAKLTEWYRGLGFVPNAGRTRDLEISESMYRPATKAD